MHDSPLFAVHVVAVHRVQHDVEHMHASQKQQNDICIT